MLYLLLKVIWLGLPGAVAILTPPLAFRLFPRLTLPLDLKKKYKGKRIFGWEKTVSWMITGLIFAHLTYIFQSFIIIRDPSALFYDIKPSLLELPWYYGLAIGLGSLSFDVVKSFFKRQKGIKPRHPWFPWDQISWIIGVVTVQSLFFYTGLYFVTLSFIAGIILHLLVEMFRRFIKAEESII